MSYEVIKSISFKNNQVNITSYCNNVIPRIAEKWHCKPLTILLLEKGKEEVIKEILKEFWSQNLQGTSTIYGKFIEVFFKENKHYNGENVGKTKGQKKYEGSSETVKYTYEDLKNDLFDQFLQYKEKTSKKQLYIAKVENCFIYKLTSRRAMTTFCKNSAKKFTLAQAENIKQRFSNHNIEIIGV